MDFKLKLLSPFRTWLAVVSIAIITLGSGDPSLAEPSAPPPPPTSRRPSRPPSRQSARPPVMVVAPSHFFLELAVALTQSTPLSSARTHVLRQELAARSGEYGTASEFTGTLNERIKLRELGQELANAHRLLLRLESQNFLDPGQNAVIQSFLLYHSMLEIDLSALDSQVSSARSGVREGLIGFVREATGRAVVHPLLQQVQDGIHEVAPDLDLNQARVAGAELAASLRIRATQDELLGEIESVRSGMRAGQQVLRMVTMSGDRPGWNAVRTSQQLQLTRIFEGTSALVDAAKELRTWTTEQRIQFEEMTSEYFYNLLPWLLEDPQFKDNYYRTVPQFFSQNPQIMARAIPFRAAPNDEFSRRFIERAGYALVTAPTVQLRWIAQKPLELKVRFSQEIQAGPPRFTMTLEIQNPYGGDQKIVLEREVFSRFIAPITLHQLTELLESRDWIAPLDHVLTRSFELDARALKGRFCSVALTRPTF